jgi:hypothetical protein
MLSGTRARRTFCAVRREDADVGLVETRSDKRQEVRVVSLTHVPNLLSQRRSELDAGRSLLLWIEMRDSAVCARVSDGGSVGGAATV